MTRHKKKFLHMINNYVAEIEKMRESLKPLYHAILVVIHQNATHVESVATAASGTSSIQDASENYYEALYDSLVLLQHLSNYPELIKAEIYAVRTLAVTYQKYQKSSLECVSNLSSFVNEDVIKAKIIKYDMEVAAKHLSMCESRQKKSPTPKVQKEYEQAKITVNNQWKAFDKFRSVAEERKKKIPNELVHFFDSCMNTFMKFVAILEPVSDYTRHRNSEDAAQ